MIKIVTDTASDITLRQAAGLDVELVSLRVSFGDEPYEQLADDATFGKFYTRLAAARELPVTSQPAPADYLALFARAKSSGDDVVVITLSSGLSGTLQAAQVAAEMADYDRIWVADSQSAVIGQRLLVEYAVRLRAEGRRAGEIYAILTEAAGRVVLFGALDTLKYLRKGGRIPKSAEVLGTVMGIKPMVQLKDGTVGMAGKARGHAGVMAGMMRLMEQNASFDPAAPVYFAYTQDSQPCRTFRRLAETRFRLENTAIYPAGGIIGTHIGPGAFAAAWLTARRSQG